MKHLSSQAADAVATQIVPSGSDRTVYSQVSTDSMGARRQRQAGGAMLLASGAVGKRAKNGHRPVEGHAYVPRCGSGRLSHRTQPPRSVSTGTGWVPRSRAAGSGGEDQREHTEIEQDDDDPEQHPERGADVADPQSGDGHPLAALPGLPDLL